MSEEKTRDETVAELVQDVEQWAQVGKIMADYFRNEMDRHMMKPVEERIKEGIREEIRKRKEVADERS